MSLRTGLNGTKCSMRQKQMHCANKRDKKCESRPLGRAHNARERKVPGGQLWRPALLSFAAMDICFGANRINTLPVH